MSRRLVERNFSINRAVRISPHSDCPIEEYLQQSRNRFETTLTKICDKYETLSHLYGGNDSDNTDTTDNDDSDEESSLVGVKFVSFGYLLEEPVDDVIVENEENRDRDERLPEDDETEPVLIGEENSDDRHVTKDGIDDELFSLVSMATNCTVTCCSVVKASYSMKGKEIDGCRKDRSNTPIKKTETILRNIDRSPKRNPIDNCGYEKMSKKRKIQQNELSLEPSQKNAKSLAPLPTSVVEVQKTKNFPINNELACFQTQSNRFEPNRFDRIVLKIPKGVLDRFDPVRLFSKDNCLARFLHYDNLQRPLTLFEEKQLANIQPNIDRLKRFAKYRFLLQFYGIHRLRCLQNQCKRIAHKSFQDDFEDFVIDADLVVH